MDDDYKIKRLCIMFPKTDSYAKFTMVKVNGCIFQLKMTNY